MCCLNWQEKEQAAKYFIHGRRRYYAANTFALPSVAYKFTGQMKKFLLLAALLPAIFCSAQSKDDAAFKQRLEEYMRLTRQLRFEEIMNFTHPSMFAIVPKDQLVTMYTK